MTRRRTRTDELRAAAGIFRRLAKAVDRGELTASPRLRRLLDAAVNALEQRRY